MATSLIDSLSEPVFESDKYTDSYREALEQLIESKVAGGEATTKPGKDEDAGEVVDLMDALKASVNAARKNRPASKKAADKDTEKKRRPRPSLPRRPPPAAPARPPDGRHAAPALPDSVGPWWYAGRHGRVFDHVKGRSSCTSMAASPSAPSRTASISTSSGMACWWTAPRCPAAVSAPDPANWRAWPEPDGPESPLVRFGILGPLEVRAATVTWSHRRPATSRAAGRVPARPRSPDRHRPADRGRLRRPPADGAAIAGLAVAPRNARAADQPLTVG